MNPPDQAEAEEVDSPPIFPRPDQCRKSPSIAGVAATMADGERWLLAFDGLRKVPAAYRDALYDRWMIGGSVPVSTARACAYILLRANYDLTEAEALRLILGAQPADFCDAVVEAMLSVDPPRKTWTDWAESALYANGIRPSDVPAERLPGVLRHLTMTKRVEPHEEYTDAGEYAGKRAGLLAMAQRIEAEKASHPKGTDGPAEGGA